MRAGELFRAAVYLSPHARDQPAATTAGGPEPQAASPALRRAQRLVRRGDWLLPSSRTLNLVDLARALAFYRGSRAPLRAGARRLRDAIGTPEHLVFVLADGLGCVSLDGLPAGSFLRSHQAMVLRSVFPSSTATALTSLTTAAWPGQHGVTGWWTHLPQLNAPGALLPFVSLPNTDGVQQPLEALGVSPADAFPLAPGAMADNVAGASLLPKAIVGSVYSTYFGGKQQRIPYRTLDQAVDLAADRIASARRPTYTYLYTPEPDESAHRFGTRHGHTRGAVTHLDHALGRLAAQLPRTARLVVTGDHGLLDVAERQHHDLASNDDLRMLMDAPPSGDARVAYFRVQPDRHEAFIACFEESFEDRFLLLTIEDAERLHLFGPQPTDTATRARLGTFVAISLGADVFDFTLHQGTSAGPLYAAHHSGLTPDEMLVPLVLA